jgi:moderate conductance mechanosensitive channel
MTADLSQFSGFLQSHGIGVVVLLIVASIAFRVVRPIVHRTLVRVFRQRPSETIDAEVTAAEAAKRAATIEDLVSTLLHFTIIFVTVLVLLTWFDLLPVIAGLGVIAAALTLAGQSIVLDYLMGILIVLEGPYYKGDWIQVGAIEGEVEEIGLRRTILRDSSGTVHSVSNGAIRIASNLTRVYARMQVDMTVSFGTDLELATRVANEVGQAMAEDPAWKDRLLEVPAVSRVPALGDLGVTLRVAGKVRAADRWAAPSELRRRLIEAFVERGIEIAARGQVVADRPPTGAPVPAGSADGGNPGGGILGGGSPGGVV